MLQAEALEQIWEWLAEAADAAGEKDRLFFAKLALLLAVRVGDPAAVRSAIAESLRDLD